MADVVGNVAVAAIIAEADLFVLSLLFSLCITSNVLLCVLV